MSGEGIRLEIQGSTFKGDLRQIFGSILEAAAKTFFAAKTTGLVSAGVPNAISGFFGALKNIKFEDTNEYRAWLLVLGGLLYAIERVLAETELKVLPSSGAIKSLAGDLTSRVGTRKYQIEPGFFEAPEQLSLLDDVADELQSWLEPFGREQSSQSLRPHIARHFAAGLHRVWMKDKDRFAPIEQAINSPFLPALRQRQEMDGYLQYLEEQFTNLPLIGQDEDDSNAVTLGDVFIPLRAYVQESVTEKSRDPAITQAESDDTTRKLVISLTDALTEWVTNPDRRDAIRIVSGGPGIGKSSSMKAFATNFARSGRAYPVLIPLQKLERPDQSLRDRVKDYFVNTKSVPLNVSPFDLLDQLSSEHPLLLIFDGLDELVRPGKDADEIARNFMFDLRGLLEDFNRSAGRARVLAVITGRVASAESAARALKCSGNQLLFLLRFVEDASPKDRSLIDPRDLLKEDQRLSWWARWSAAAKDVPKSIPKILLHKDLFEITVEPLLLYFVAFVRPWEGKQADDGIDRNNLYDRLLQDFHRRECTKGSRNFANEFSEFQYYETVLQAMAMAAWYEGTSRTGTIAAVENLLRGWNDELLAAFQRTIGMDRPAIGAALAFYMRPGERPNSFEFLHKTFAEYLVGRRLLAMVKSWSEEWDLANSSGGVRRKSFDATSFLREWLRLTGSRGIDEDLLRFVRDEVSRVNGSEPNIMKSSQRMLVHCFQVALRDGFPAHELFQLRDDQIARRPQTYREAAQQARNAEETLLVMLNATILANLYADDFQVVDIRPADHSYQTIRLLIRRLGGGSWEGNIRVAYALFDGLDLSGEWFSSQDLFAISARKTNFSRANFFMANLGNARLEGANFHSAALSEASLQNGRLDGANLEGAELDNAILSHCSFRDANLQDASLVGAKLDGCHFDRANMEKADLERASLKGADLQQSNLRGANLKGADLGSAKLQGADLEDAEMEGANLD